MRKGSFTIKTNRTVAAGVREMTLEGDASATLRPGQFVEVALDGFYLRRPFAAVSYGPDHLTILYKIVGRGTRSMSEMGPGRELDIITGLGNGFDAGATSAGAVLFAGGMGVAPLYPLAKDLVAAGKKVDCVLGFNTAEDICYEDEFRSLGASVHIATLDGSAGTRGFVTDAFRAAGISGDMFYACGPLAMERAVCLNVDMDGEVSLEERMGCGFGICMGCTIMTKNGQARVCKDGPVFRKEDLIW